MVQAENSFLGQKKFKMPKKLCMVTHPSGVYFVHVFVIFHAHLCTYAYAVTRLGDGKQCFSISTIPRRVRKTTAHSYSLRLHCFQYNVDKLHKPSGALPHHIPFWRIAQTVETTEPRLHVDPSPSTTPPSSRTSTTCNGTSKQLTSQRSAQRESDKKLHRWKGIPFVTDQRWPTATNGLLMISEQIRTWICLFMINAVESQDSEAKIRNTPGPSNAERRRNNLDSTISPRFLLLFLPFLDFSCSMLLRLLRLLRQKSPRRGSAVHRQVPRPGTPRGHEATRPRGHGGTRCENPELHTLHTLDTLDTFTWLLSNYSQNTSSWKFCLAGAFRLCTSWMAEALYCTERFGRWSHVRPGAMWGMWGTKARNEKKQVENVESF